MTVIRKELFQGWCFPPEEGPDTRTKFQRLEFSYFIHLVVDTLRASLPKQVTEEELTTLVVEALVSEGFTREEISEAPIDHFCEWGRGVFEGEEFDKWRKNDGDPTAS